MASPADRRVPTGHLAEPPGPGEPDGPPPPLVGILMLDTHFPRLPGDLGNPATFPFPVRYHRVAGASPERVVRTRDPALLAPFVAGARELERGGARAIATTCGFLAVLQAELAAAVGVPVLTSSLLLVPLVQRMLAADRAIGVLTIDSTALSPEHLAAAGIAPGPRVVIRGLEREGRGVFARSIMGDATTLDVEACRDEHRSAAARLVEEHPEVGAIVLECTNMPPYRDAVERAAGRPVWDAADLVRLVHAGVAGRPA